MSTGNFVPCRKATGHWSELLRQAVHASLPLGEGMLADPFMGSTVAAAVALGYSAVGVERHREYFDMASKAIPELSRLEVVGGSRPASVNSGERMLF